MTTTHNLHQDQKKTLVEVEGKLFKLEPVSLTLDEVKSMEYKDQPHVRRLNPIPQRTPEQQKTQNDFQEDVKAFARQVPGYLRKKKKITSVKAAVRESANIPEEVKKLLDEKLTCKDPVRTKVIRRTLRKLDYKRYLEAVEQ